MTTYRVEPVEEMTPERVRRRLARAYSLILSLSREDTDNPERDTPAQSAQQEGQFAEEYTR